MPQGAANVPSSSHPWTLRVDDGGYLNRSGRITQFDLIWHDAQGDATYTGAPVPQPTLEGHSVFVEIPQPILAVDGPGPRSKELRFGPNPVIAGNSVSFALPAMMNPALDIFDIGGRRVAHIRFRASANGSQATWETRDATGHPLPPGIYLARYGPRAAVPIDVIPR